MPRTPPVTRTPVTPGRQYGDYRENLRADFWFACAYCTISEMEASGIGFQIDHFQPTACGGSDVYDNLMYSCSTCNNRKRDYWPKAATQEAILKVDIDVPDEHLAADEADLEQVVHLTKKGATTIAVVDLNRQAMRVVRRNRRRLGYSRQLIASGLRHLRGLNVDFLPPAIRFRVRSMVKDLESDTTEVERVVREEVERQCRSELLDTDPELRERTRARREWLKQLGVEGPDL